MRSDNRTNEQARPLTIVRNFTKYAKGSVLVSLGETKVICTASVDEKVPHFLRDSGRGWLTAEYALLPSATHTRVTREVSKGKPSGRTSEIQRLIGRALRSVIDFEKLGERTIYIDADVIQADGGTRTAAITGAMAALADGCQAMLNEGIIYKNPIREWISAISVGIFNGELICDLTYEEDSQAEVDMNVVMTENGKLVEVQGTAEKQPFTHDQLIQMLGLAEASILTLISQIKSGK
ncbi:ribonuclease PH [Thermoproteota archaeon]